MLRGLEEGDEKVSESDPDSAIFYDDPTVDARRKIKRAFCTPCDMETNPVLGYATALVTPRLGHLEVKRTEEKGGNVDYNDAETLINDFKGARLHPGTRRTLLPTPLTG